MKISALCHHSESWLLDTHYPAIFFVSPTIAVTSGGRPSETIGNCSLCRFNRRLQVHTRLKRCARIMARGFLSAVAAVPRCAFWFVVLVSFSLCHHSTELAIRRERAI